MTYILSLAAVLVVLLLSDFNGLPGGESEINKGLYAQRQPRK